ncbi:MAG: hypothetical protein JST66_05980 [Bacteroidetes bacterium]|nr:hypothetical protein [Bacteroidota bacterium]
MLPFHCDRYSFSSPLAAEEIISQMQKESGTGRHFEALEPVAPGAAWLNTHFRTRPNIDYRNSFLPVLEMRIQPASGGSEVAVSCRMHRGIQWFTAIWLTPLAVWILFGIISLLRGSFEPIFLVPLAMVVCMLVLMRIFYGSERDRSLRFIKERLLLQ